MNSNREKLDQLLEAFEDYLILLIREAMHGDRSPAARASTRAQLLDAIENMDE